MQDATSVISDGSWQCPDGKHAVGTTPAAADGLRALPARIAARISSMLCEIAEVAALSGPVPGWDDKSLLRLYVENVLVLYSIGADANLTVHHVVDSESQARTA